MPLLNGPRASSLQSWTAVSAGMVQENHSVTLSCSKIQQRKPSHHTSSMQFALKTCPVTSTVFQPSTFSRFSSPEKAAEPALQEGEPEGPITRRDLARRRQDHYKANQPHPRLTPAPRTSDFVPPGRREEKKKKSIWTTRLQWAPVLFVGHGGPQGRCPGRVRIAIMRKVQHRHDTICAGFRELTGVASPLPSPCLGSFWPLRDTLQS